MILRKKEKLDKYFGGVCYMKKIFDMIFVIDVVKEKIVVVEVRKFYIFIVVFLDINCDFDLVDYFIFGNDDVICFIRLFCKEMSEVILEG